MINKNRIVPVQATDLITLYSIILKQNSNNSTLAKVDAKNEAGEFAVASASTPLLCSEPVSALDLAAAISSATIYFVPAYDFAGFTQNGTPCTTSGTVEADGNTLYSATLATGTLTYAKVGL